MSVTDLVARCTTGSCHPSIRLSVVVQFITEILTWCVFLKRKHDAFNATLTMYFFHSQIRRDVNLLNQNLTRFEIFHFKIMLFKWHQKCKLCRFHGVKWTKTWFFGCKHFFKIGQVEKILIQNPTHCIFLQSRIWRFVRLFNQNLMRFENFISKSDRLENLNSKSDKF